MHIASKEPMISFEYSQLPADRDRNPSKAKIIPDFPRRFNPIG